MPAKKHDFTAAEIKAGVFVLAGVVVFVVFLAMIQGYRPPVEEHVFICRFKDTLGLNKGADVRFGGLKVGRVRSIEADPELPEMIRVEAAVPRWLRVNEESIAYVSQTTLTAEKHLEISTGDSDALLLADGAEIPVREGGLLDQAGQLAGTVQSVVQDVQALLGVREAQQKSEKGELNTTVATIFDDLDVAVTEGTGLVTDARDAVSQYRDDIDEILQRVKDVSVTTRDLMTEIQDTVGESREDVRAALEKVPPILEQVALVSEELDEIAANLQQTLDHTTSLTGEANGLLMDNRPVLEDTLIDLRETVRYLRDFSRTIAEEPQSVIRGSGPEGRKAN
jgi:phospholipid/cholesterol/gamma-HCH transport system substrate-binding protein